MKPQVIPEGFHTVTPYLTVEGASQLITFLEKAFDGQVNELIKRPDGHIGHAQVLVGNSMIMLAEAWGEMKAAPAALYLYVEDVDATFRRALEAGGTAIREPQNQFYGDRGAGVQDPFGITWWIATHLEDVPSEELQKRADEAMKQCEQT